MKWFGFFLLPAMMLVPSAKAGNYCRSSYRASYSYSYSPAYYAPSYASPTYTYQNSYDYPVYLKAVKAYVSPDYYSSVQDYYRDKLLVDAVAGKTAEVLKSQTEMNNLKQEVESLRRQLSGGGSPAQPAPQVLPQEQPPDSKPSVMPKAASRGGHPVPQGLDAIVQASCVRCHGGTSATTGGGLDFRDLASTPASVRLAAKAAVDDGYMPKGSKPLDDNAAALFHQWATGRKGTSLTQK